MAVPRTLIDGAGRKGFGGTAMRRIAAAPLLMLPLIAGQPAAAQTGAGQRHADDDSVVLWCDGTSVRKLEARITTDGLTTLVWSSILLTEP